ncbi:hypothetical protein GPECTOR_43g872 [Gonium pectorale]|uniref:Uncharacterized protein n=1 Tax=Gonium pectorale TaxID=33097 RepID=A0A150G9B1_GONPE|nr:hypothetical protein GPECTOR_43g872 [Gonium pectorale]|eukprot:KXZ46436.1 hypothetical protein GPECTOR_43g872 [Gonium pectorale]
MASSSRSGSLGGASSGGMGGGAFGVSSRLLDSDGLALGLESLNMIGHARATKIVSLDIGTYGRPAGDGYPKTRSAVLLKGSRGVAFGHAAVNQMMEMDETERQDGRYFLVYGTAFKLGLHSAQRGAGLPEGITPELAFCEFLRLLKMYVLQHLQSIAPHGAPNALTARGLVRWCLTVPAMWSDEAKGAVRRAAHRAGLITRLDSDDLMVVLEPEAAALHVSNGGGGPADRPRLFPAGLVASPHAAAVGARRLAEDAPAMRPGEVFMVVDAGGGTVDITVHEVEQRGDTAVLSEAQAVPGIGEMYGATGVDEAFTMHFRERIKREFDSEQEQGLEPAGPEEAEAEADADDGWAGPTGRRGRTWRVPIPPNLHSAMDGGVRADLMMDQGLDDSLVLTRAKMAELFRDVVEGILGAVRRQTDALAAAPTAPVARCSKVLLVGGFGCSPYLQARLAAAVSGRLAAGGGVLVLQGTEPASSVLQGAALYGMRPDLIRARTSRMTYGVRTAVPYDDGMPAYNTLHPFFRVMHLTPINFRRPTIPASTAAFGAGKFWHPAEFCYYSSAGFSPFVTKGQLVAADEVVTHVFTPLSADQQIASVELWATDQPDVRWISEEASAAAAAGGAGAGGGSMRHVANLQVLLIRDTSSPSGSAAAPSSSTHVGRAGGFGGFGGGDEEDERLIEVSLAFGRTEIKVTARDVLTGRNYTTKVRFAFG